MDIKIVNNDKISLDYVNQIINYGVDDPNPNFSPITYTHSD